MDTHKKIREPISAFADGALPEADVELAMAALQCPDGQAAWNLYHQIGDVLRATPTPDLSPEFAAKLAARLAAESLPPGRDSDSAPAMPTRLTVTSG